MTQHKQEFVYRTGNEQPPQKATRLLNQKGFNPMGPSRSPLMIYDQQSAGEINN